MQELIKSFFPSIHAYCVEIGLKVKCNFMDVLMARTVELRGFFCSGFFSDAFYVSPHVRFFLDLILISMFLR